MVRRCKEDAEKTRVAILESALDIFSQKGYAKTTFDEIAARAGFTKGAVYWYFKNKADLLAALIVEYHCKKLEEVSPLLPIENTLDNLLEYFLIWARLSKIDLRYAMFHRFILCQVEWSEALALRVKAALKDSKENHVIKTKQVLEELNSKGLLKDNLDLEIITHIIVSSYMGITFAVLSKSHDGDLEVMVKTGLGLIFESIKK